MLAWVASGLAAGWVTGYALRGEGYGLIGNLLIGLSGGIVGGWVFGALGVSPGVSHHDPRADRPERRRGARRGRPRR